MSQGCSVIWCGICSYNFASLGELFCPFHRGVCISLSEHTRTMPSTRKQVLISVQWSVYTLMLCSFFILLINFYLKKTLMCMLLIMNMSRKQCSKWDLCDSKKYWMVLTHFIRCSFLCCVAENGWTHMDDGIPYFFFIMCSFFLIASNHVSTQHFEKKSNWYF